MLLLPVGILTAANDNIVIGCADGQLQFLTIQLSGTWTGTVNFQGSLNNATYAPVRVTRLVSGTVGAGFTAAGVYRLNATGLSQARLRFNPATSGTVVVTAALSAE